MNSIDLNNLELKTFTEQDVPDYSLLNNLNPENIIQLNLYKNQLTDISGIKLFKNIISLNLNYNKIFDISDIKNLKKLEYLYLGDNEITDISVIKDLNKLEYLDIIELKLESDQIKYINSLKNLKTLYCYKGFKDMSVLKELNKKIIIEK